MTNKVEVHNGNGKGQIKRLIYAYFDFEDYDEVIKHRWYLRKHNGREYPVAHIPKNEIFSPLMCSGINSLGNFLLNPPNGLHVKYRDNNPFNCRRDNLYLPSLEK